MNILKHMEAVFVATVVFTVGGLYVKGTLPEAHAKATVIATTATTATTGTQVVVVKAKRMNAEEKRQSLHAERIAGDSLAGAQKPASRI